MDLYRSTAQYTVELWKTQGHWNPGSELDSRRSSFAKVHGSMPPKAGQGRSMKVVHAQVEMKASKSEDSENPGFDSSSASEFGNPAAI